MNADDMAHVLMNLKPANAHTDGSGYSAMYHEYGLYSVRRPDGKLILGYSKSWREAIKEAKGGDVEMLLREMESLKKANGWVVENLREHGNSVVPAVLCKDYQKAIERLLSAIIGEQVVITQTDKNSYIAEVKKG